MKLRIRDLRTGRVLVVGDVMLDQYWSGPTVRISPEAPVPVVRIAEQNERVGGAANVAANIVALGATADLIGGTGDDAPGERLQRLCNALGIHTEFVRDPITETIVKLRVISQHQQLLRLDFETERPPYDAVRLQKAFANKLDEADIVVLSDYGKGFIGDSRTLIIAAREAGKRVVVDPKSSNFSRYAGAFMVTPNYAEFEACVGKCNSEQDIFDRGSKLCEDNEIEALLITRGEHGMTLVSPSRAPITLAANAREVFDVTGAGDTVCAVVSACLAADAELVDAVVYANAAAGVAVGKLGTATVSIDELEDALSSTGEPQVAGIVSVPELLPELVESRHRGERIVMTNGCFDIIHAGHVAYLEQAKALGSRLVVALNTDASVARIKGAGRPINNLADRMAIVGSLASVDWVISFDEDDPNLLVKALSPDVLVKGGDYEADEIAGGTHVLATGGEVRVLPFIEGLSTTVILEKLVEEQAAKANKQ